MSWKMSNNFDLQQKFFLNSVINFCIFSFKTHVCLYFLHNNIAVNIYFKTVFYE